MALHPRSNAETRTITYNFVRTCCLRPERDFRLRPICEGKMHSLACLPSIFPVLGFRYSLPISFWFHRMISSIRGVGMSTMSAMSLNVHKPKGRSVKKNYRNKYTLNIFDMTLFGDKNKQRIKFLMSTSQQQKSKRGKHRLTLCARVGTTKSSPLV
jgi:hypothetical protein